MVKNSIANNFNPEAYPDRQDYLDYLHRKYNDFQPEDRLKEFFNLFEEKDILLTTSFGSSSIVLLSMVSKIKPALPVYFIDTGYHFEETYEYKELIKDQLGLNLIEIHPEETKHQFTRKNKTWIANHDLCCMVNKVDPLEKIKRNHKVWISGLMAHQNANRSGLRIFEKSKGILKFHPLLDMTREDISLYKFIYQLPENRLIHKGYSSIGCIHCTKKGNGREGRWAGTDKTECGIHI
ncbi:phosphoadenylyl-sulfate reductase [Mangrovivirga cuniculi]|uniref:Adenosine 5'-phosphosulfate reductase n=1 Tax=Mangrovivirga cuniculi TaxID=2715131 RepID=A0A4D7JR46_9BACT|nr:phosphoadenylyl-sulfate reductase [Mangrovivirga cuniculi]QCK15990.1 phosphoadenylyl-sulfate reductase [Mangrovivirga cuniculi]